MSLTSCCKIWLQPSPTGTHYWCHPSHLKFSLSFVFKISLEWELKNCHSGSYWEQEICLSRLPESHFGPFLTGLPCLVFLFMGLLTKYWFGICIFFLQEEKLLHFGLAIWLFKLLLILHRSCHICSWNCAESLMEEYADGLLTFKKGILQQSKWKLN